jgi:hypothetical protein
MAMRASETARVDGTVRALPPRLPSDDLFGRQPAATGELPDPRPLLENLTRCDIENIAGARDLEQNARWVDDSVYTKLLKRVVVSAQARQAARRPATRPVITLGNVTVCEPRDGVVEAVIIVHSRMRTRAVAIRLEGLDRRWRATSIHVL